MKNIQHFGNARDSLKVTNERKKSGEVHDDKGKSGPSFHEEMNGGAFDAANEQRVDMDEVIRMT